MNALGWLLGSPKNANSWNPQMRCVTQTKVNSIAQDSWESNLGTQHIPRWIQMACPIGSLIVIFLLCLFICCVYVMCLLFICFVCLCSYLLVHVHFMLALLICPSGSSILVRPFGSCLWLVPFTFLYNSFLWLIHLACPFGLSLWLTPLTCHFGLSCWLYPSHFVCCVCLFVLVRLFVAWVYDQKQGWSIFWLFFGLSLWFIQLVHFFGLPFWFV